MTNFSINLCIFILLAAFACLGAAVAQESGLDVKPTLSCPTGFILDDMRCVQSDISLGQEPSSGINGIEESNKRQTEGDIQNNDTIEALGKMLSVLFFGAAMFFLIQQVFMKAVTFFSLALVMPYSAGIYTSIRESIDPLNSSALVYTVIAITVLLVGLFAYLTYRESPNPTSVYVNVRAERIRPNRPEQQLPTIRDISEHHSRTDLPINPTIISSRSPENSPVDNSRVDADLQPGRRKIILD